MIRAFLDEIVKVGAHQVAAATMSAPAPGSNTIGALVRKALVKRAASDLLGEHEQYAPPAIELNPADAGTRLPNIGTSAAAVRPGKLGAVTTPSQPIDAVPHNSWWSQ